MKPQPDRYGIPLPPTPETPCQSCGRPVPGTRAGYATYCPTCLAAGAEGEPEAPVAEYPYRTGHQALARTYYAMARYRGVPARWPAHVTIGPDRGEYLPRVDGGPGSQRPLKAAEAAHVDGIVLSVCTEAERDVIAAWAVGLLDRERDGWKWAAGVLGIKDEGRAHRTLGAICARVYGALRERGVIAPRETETTAAGAAEREVDVRDYWSGWKEIGAEVGVGEKAAARYARLYAWPIGYVGRTPILSKSYLREWLAARAAEVTNAA